MKILHIVLCCNAFKDGWSYQENCIPRYQKEFGYDVEIITVPFTVDSKGNRVIYPKHKYLDQNNIPITRLSHLVSNKFKLSLRFRLFKNLYKMVENIRPDIIFIHGLQFLDIRKIAKYVKRNKYVKVYVDGHEDYYNSAKNFLSRYVLHGLVWRLCAHLIEPYTSKFWGVTPARVDFLIKMYKLPKSKVDLLVMGAEDEKVQEAKKNIHTAELKEQYGIKSDDFIIMSGGKLDQNKPEILNIMRAVNQLQNNKIKFLFLGSVSKEYYDDFNQQLSDKVKYIGWIKSKDTYTYFNLADLVIFPGLHSVFWEQVVGLGRPAVFKYIEGFTHIDLEGNCKFLYKSSVEEIMSIINLIYNDKALYETMLSVSQKKGLEKFSYRMISRRSIELE